MKTAHFLRTILRSSKDLSAGALSYTPTTTRAFKLEEVTVHADANITETITITRVSVYSSSYDVVLAKRVMEGEADFVFRPQGECNFFAGDKVKVQCTNANTTGIVYCEVKTSEL